MSLFHNLTRGGQTNIHQLRMIRQVIGIGLLISSSGAGGYFAWSTYDKVPLYAWYYTWEYAVAHLNLAVIPAGQAPKASQMFSIKGNRPYRRSSQSITQDPYIIQIANRVEAALWSNLYGSLKTFGLSIVAIMIVWSLMGRSHRKLKHERGSVLLSPKPLANQIRRAGKASWLHLGGLPLIKDKETAHILITGTTGAGKSNCLHHLLPQIRERGQRAIIVDLNGDFTAHYYRQGYDLILNPFDHRSQPWNVWCECQTVAQFDTFAEAMVPPKQYNADNFWDDAGRILLSVALQKLKFLKKMSTAELLRILVHADLKEIQSFFKNTEASSYTTKENEKTSLSVRASLAVQLTALKHLEETKTPFSIRDWISGESTDQWLFLTARPDQRKTLRPLMSAWMDTAINALMTLAPDQKRRLWFILDELPALQKLPSLQPALAESRKYGGCIVAGLQSMPQISEVYGQTAAHALLDLFNTQIFFRSTDPTTTSWISKVLGEAEQTEAVENLSYGANTIRDGVSLNRQTKTRPLVMPVEIAALKDLEAYIKLPEGLPVTKLQMEYQQGEVIAEAFKLKAEKFPEFNKSKPGRAKKSFPARKPKAPKKTKQPTDDSNTSPFMMIDQ